MQAYTLKELRQYKISEDDPRNFGTMVTALNRESYLERLKEVKKGKVDMVIMFFSNDECTLCEGLWPVLDKSIQLFQA